MRRILWCELPQSYNDEFKKRPTRTGSIPPGSKYVIAALGSAGFAVDTRLWEDITPPQEHICVMVSIMFVRQYSILPEMFRRLGMDPRKDKRSNVPVIVGGHGIHNPVAIEGFFDKIVLGDGEAIACDVATDPRSWDDTPHVWPNNVGCAAKRAEPCSNLITRQYGQEVAFVEIARGCNSKCNFCELGWTHTYRKAERDSVLDLIRSIPKGSHVNLLAPDATAWPHYSEAIEECKKCRVYPMFNSMRIDSSFSQLHKAKTCRFGIEGASERLRKLLWKPYKNTEVLRRLTTLNAEERVFGMKLFFIFDLPWTQRRDYVELEKLFRWLRLPLGGKVTVKFTAFTPQPGTPLQNAPKRLNLQEFVFLKGLTSEKIKKETERPGLSGTAIHFLGIQNQVNQARETYFVRAGRELVDTIEDAASAKTIAQLRVALKKHGISLDDVLGGAILGQAVEPIREWTAPNMEISKW